MKNLLLFICIAIFTACSTETKKEIEMPYSDVYF
jgi:hypothetical protein